MGKGEDLLVVDDESVQREIASGLLRRLGYKVTAVASGEEALEYLKNHRVDLVILDMIMEPGMGGRETYAAILSLVPDQKAIVATGFADTEDIRYMSELGASCYVRKPYTIEEIGLAVRNELS